MLIFTLLIVCLPRSLLCVPAPRYRAQWVLPAISIHGQLSRTNATNRFYFEGYITCFQAPAEKALLFMNKIFLTISRNLIFPFLNLQACLLISLMWFPRNHPSQTDNWI